MVCFGAKFTLGMLTTIQPDVIRGTSRSQAWRNLHRSCSVALPVRPLCGRSAMNLDGKLGNPDPEPRDPASTMLTPSYQDHLLGRALPARGHADELLDAVLDQSLARGGMSLQEVDAILATAAGRPQ